jgi:HK97 family phage prohead protease
MEYKTFEFQEFKAMAADEKLAQFSGYAATFGNVDLSGDRIIPGAFAKSIVQRKGDIDVFWGHPDPIFGSGEPIGSTSFIAEDHKGLLLTVDLVTSTSRSHDAHEWIKFKMKRDSKPGLSIGFQTKDWEMDRDVRVLKEIDLHEASMVNFPANPRARIEEVKSAQLNALEEILRRAGFFDSGNTVRNLEQILRDVGLSKPEAKHAIADVKTSAHPTSEAQRDVSGLVNSICREQIALLAAKHLNPIFGDK